MIEADKISQIAYQLPFKPFRVRLISGEVIQINRTFRTTVATDRVIFGVDEDPKTGVSTRMRIVSLADIADVQLADAG